MKRLSLFLCCIGFVFFTAAQHPVAFATKADYAAIRTAIPKYPLLNQSYADLKKDVDKWLGKDIDVPYPKDPAGGYTHDKHKSNYTLMFNSGLLYNLTGDVRYAMLVKNMLLKYATLNPTLKKHPQATSSSPGHIFWQALNDANWLVYTGMAYDCIYNSLTAAERKTMEDGAFKPEVDFMTGDLESWFNLIHNHGVWACAGVGIVGIATGNKEYVQKALYGTKGDGKSGFIAQLDNLFSPDGYYTEGPYYVRYAILPYYVFANALNKARPDLKIFEHRNRILQKALLACLQQTNTDGTFLPINDDLKDKDFTSNELVTAIDIAWEMYGANDGLLTVAKKQNRVLVNKGGAGIAAALQINKAVPAYYPYTSAEFVDGAKGDEGGLSLLRTGSGSNLTTLVFKYASHGLSHGHYDQLGFFLYDNGNEILQDYGSARFIGIEQKYGGRYLPENEKYAGQTIAHNTLVVDEKSHFDAKEKEAEKYHAEKLFSSIRLNKAVQVVSAKEDHAYAEVQLQRTLYLLQLPGRDKPLVVDIFHTNAAGNHQYDLPFQYNGQVINTSFKYQPSTTTQQALGTKNGYEFLWKEAEAKVKDTTTQFTFLNGQSYYSICSRIDGPATIFLTRTGANDPSFNLRREPSYIIRTNGPSKTFVNAIELHGRFDPKAEFSSGSYPSVQQIELVKDDADYTIATITVVGKKLLIAQCNKDFTATTSHRFTQDEINLNWTGPFAVLYNNQLLK